jgi:hypothetical protein
MLIDKAKIIIDSNFPKDLQLFTLVFFNQNKGKDEKLDGTSF